MNQADLGVFATTAMKTAFDELAPQFQHEVGHRVAARFGPSVRVAKWLADGEAADVAILPRAAAEDMLAPGVLLAGSLADIARSSLGVVVQKGAPKPDIGSAEAFRRAMLAAKTVALSKPVGGGLSGAHMARVFQELGIAEAVAAKATYGAGGVTGLVGLIVGRGEAEVGVQQIAELMAAPDVDFVGPLPDALQCVTLFTAGVPANAPNAAAGRSLIAFLTAPEAARVISAKGLEPA